MKTLPTFKEFLEEETYNDRFLKKLNSANSRELQIIRKNFQGYARDALEALHGFDEESAKYEITKLTEPQNLQKFMDAFVNNLKNPSKFVNDFYVLEFDRKGSSIWLNRKERIQIASELNVQFKQTINTI